MEKVNNCVNCQGKRFILIELIKEPPIAFSIYSCSSCGLFFQNPMPSKHFLKNVYKKIYKKQYNLILAEEAFEKKNEKQELKRIQEIEKYRKGGNLLDIGASTGFFLSEVAKKKHWKAYGVEYVKEAALKAKKAFSLDIISGEVNDARLPNEYFDVITMHSVLEHIPNVEETIKIVNNKLKHEGLFVFNVPNIRSFEFYLFKLLHKSFPGFIFEHLYYFNTDVITSFLKRNGFEIITITSRHYSTLRFPSFRPFINWLTFLPKVFLEYTDIGGKLKFGNILYIYAKKID